MNRALIDTDIVSYYFKGDKTVVKNFAVSFEETHISSDYGMKFL